MNSPALMEAILRNLGLALRNLSVISEVQEASYVVMGHDQLVQKAD